MINWTITPDVEHPDAPGELFWAVNGENPDKDHPRQDVHNVRHLPSRYEAIKFLIDHHMKMGDTLHLDGPDTGHVLRVGMVKIGDTIVYDVGTHQVQHSAELIDWLDNILKPGDTVSYLPKE